MYGEGKLRASWLDFDNKQDNISEQGSWLFYVGMERKIVYNTQSLKKLCSLLFFHFIVSTAHNLRIKDLPIAELSKKHTNQTISSKFSTLTGLVAATNCFDRASCI